MNGMTRLTARIEQEKEALKRIARRCEQRRAELDTIGIELLSIKDSLRVVRMETDQLHLFSA